MTSTDENKEVLLQALQDVRISSGEQFSLGHREVEAELYTEVTTVEDLVRCVTAARHASYPFTLLGTGTYSFDDTIIPGLTIKNNCRKFAILSMRGKVTAGDTTREQVYVSAEGGVGLNQLVRFTIDEGLGGLEIFLGESGTVGDALLANLVYEKEHDYLIKHVFTIRLLTKENEVVEVSAEPFLYPLDGNMIEKRSVIPLSVVFAVTPMDKHELWKRGTQAAFERNQNDLLDPLKGNFTY